MTARRMRRTLAAGLVFFTVAFGADAPSATRDDQPADEAVERALRFLQSSQQTDGAWEAGFGKATSTTSLAIMAFLAAGHTPDQPGPYRDRIERGVRFVLDNQRPSGLLAAESSHGPMYCHGISTLMLAEMIGMLSDRELAARCRDALAKAVALILQAQAVSKPDRERGGWRYRPDSIDSDLSVTAWQVMALRAAKDAGCAIPSANIDQAVDFLKRCALPATDGGGFSYQPGMASPNNPRTGAGILALELCGSHLTPEAIAGAKYLVDHPPRWSSEYFFYEVYYCPAALHQIGDREFQPYFDQLRSILLERQERDGSWLSGDNYDRQGGRNYCTSMAALALCVPRQLLPIYQR